MHCHPTRGGLPFSTYSLLGLDQAGDTVVLDGQILHLLWRPPREGEKGLVVNGRPQGVERVGDLESRLDEAFFQCWPLLYRWVAYQDARGPDPAQCLPRLAPQLQRSIERFVHQTLIPRLQAQTGSALEAGKAPLVRAPAPEPREEAPDLSLGHEIPVDLVHQVAQALGQAWPRWSAFSGQGGYELAPFYGRGRTGKFHLCWGEREFVAIDRQDRYQLVQQCDHLLEKTIADLLRPAMTEDSPASGREEVYQDGTYSILRSAGGNFFCCRQIPAYVVEGNNYHLYRFEPVEVGVWLEDLEVKKVVYPFNVLVMHPYRHMFVFSMGSGAHICMPRPDEYYHHLCRLPLEEALLQHLESARLTLCSGYHAGNPMAHYHPIASLGLPAISLAEAQGQGLPVYWFYRHRHHSSLR